MIKLQVQKPFINTTKRVSTRVELRALNKEELHAFTDQIDYKVDHHVWTPCMLIIQRWELMRESVVD